MKNDIYPHHDNGNRYQENSDDSYRNNAVLDMQHRTFQILANHLRGSEARASNSSLLNRLMRIGVHLDPAARRRRRPVEARGDHAEDHTEGHIDYP
jgi:hypothetical protein